MDEQALERARERISEAREGRFEALRLEAALERARMGVESLAAAAERLEHGLPDRVGETVHEAVQEGLRREVGAVARNLAEIRGLLNQAIHRLERLEQELLAERRARIDDLEVLVELVSSGWRGVDERLRRLERNGHAGDVIPLLAAS
jgi:chromosome segregation ATPase